MFPLPAILLDFAIAALVSVALALALMGAWVVVSRLIGMAVRLGNRGGSIDGTYTLHRTGDRAWQNHRRD